MARSRSATVKACLYGAGLLATLASVGCQADYSGQTLPSPYWQQDDIQYFPPGPEFKLSREAAALKTYGTGKNGRRPAAPLGPPQAAPTPGGDLDAATPTTVVPLPAVPGAPPPAVVPGDVPAGEAEAPAPPEDAPEAEDPFNP